MPFPQRPDSPLNPSRLHGSFGAPYFLYDIFKAGRGGAPTPPADCALMLADGTGFLLLQDGSLLGLQCVDFVILPPTGNCSGVTTSSNGSLLAGMTVQVTFQDLTTQTATWVSTGVTSGQAVGTNWSVSESGDTSTGTWTATNSTGKGIASILFNACPANTVFDTTFGSNTAGTGAGLNFVQTGGTFSGTVQATYLSASGLNNAAPLGDIYRQLFVQFPLAGGFTSGSTLLFQQGMAGCVTCIASTPPSAVDACETFTTTSTGATLAGSTVAVTFTDSTTETVVWAATGAQSGHAVGIINSFTITQTGDTIFNSFFLTNSSGKGITQIVFAVDPSNSIYDTQLGSSKTPGTDGGQTFSVSGGTYTGTTDYLYTGPTSLPSQTPRGDLFTTLTIVFSTAGGLPTGQTLTWLADTDGCTDFGIFGPVDTVNLLWHVECEFRVYQQLSPLTVASGGNPVVLWGDLVDGRDIAPLHVPLNTGSQVTNYQTGATGTGRPDIQVGSDWRAIFQGNFNFFTASGKYSYAVFYRAQSTHIALIDDGTPATNGLALGYGNPNLDTGGGGALMMGIKDGVGATENTGIAALGVGVVVVTYDGTTGSTLYYFCHANLANNGGQVDASAPFVQVGLTASGGFALGGTFGNADPNRLDTSLSLCEAAVWSGILTPTQVQNIADRGFTYWGYT